MSWMELFEKDNDSDWIEYWSRKYPTQKPEPEPEPENKIVYKAVVFLMSEGGVQ